MTQIGLNDAVVIFKTGQVWGGGCGTEFWKKRRENGDDCALGCTHDELTRCATDKLTLSYGSCINFSMINPHHLTSRHSFIIGSPRRTGNNSSPRFSQWAISIMLCALPLRSSHTVYMYACIYHGNHHKVWEWLTRLQYYSDISREPVFMQLVMFAEHVQASCICITSITSLVAEVLRLLWLAGRIILITCICATFLLALDVSWESNFRMPLILHWYIVHV